MNTVQPIRDLETVEKFKRILKAKNTRNYLMFVLGINTGLRVGDFVTLKMRCQKLRLCFHPGTENRKGKADQNHSATPERFKRLLAG
jgi:integrase